MPEVRARQPAGAAAPGLVRQAAAPGLRPEHPLPHPAGLAYAAAMRLVIQRVSSASVTVDGRTVGEIGPGFLVLAGFGKEDSPDLPQRKVWGQMIDKLINLRVFPDDEGKLNRSLLDIGGAILAVSQFTLYADCRKGRRPSFHLAADAALGEELYRAFVAALQALLPGRVAQGVFGADMDVRLVNAGPVTIVLDSSAFAAQDAARAGKPVAFVGE